MKAQEAYDALQKSTQHLSGETDRDACSREARDYYKGAEWSRPKQWAMNAYVNACMRDKQEGD